MVQLMALVVGGQVCGFFSHHVAFIPVKERPGINIRYLDCSFENAHLGSR